MFWVVSLFVNEYTVFFIYSNQELFYLIMTMVDAGMSELLRPALYGSEHPVENLRTSGQLKRFWIGGLFVNRLIFWQREFCCLR